jgi:hypothetical protein
VCPIPPDIARNSVDDLLAQLVGYRIDGGCDDCGAYQTVRLDADEVWVVTVHHDDCCPVWRSIRNGGAA